MAFPKSLKELCGPALVYFLISIFSVLLILFQNLGNNDCYSIGSFTCDVSSTALVFISKIIYILFWTWILNLICKDGHSYISWLLILLPYILLFVVIGVVMLN